MQRMWGRMPGVNTVSKFETEVKKQMVAHIEQHLQAFKDHAGDDRTPEEYLSEYWNKWEQPGEIYYRLCNDLGIQPVV